MEEQLYEWEKKAVETKKTPSWFFPTHFIGYPENRPQTVFIVLFFYESKAKGEVIITTARRRNFLGSYLPTIETESARNDMPLFLRAVKLNISWRV